MRLRMAPKIDSLGVPEADFISFLKLSFGQKRKTLWNNLKARYQPESLRRRWRRLGKADGPGRGFEPGKERGAV